jgi:hypothetical protein
MKDSCCCPIPSSLGSTCSDLVRQESVVSHSFIGRKYYQDFKLFGIVKNIVGDTITVKRVCENIFMNGQIMDLSFIGSDLLGLKHYMNFKLKRKKLSK